jgi:hypothetical protein
MPNESTYGQNPMSAENYVTLCDLGIFADEAAEPVSAQNVCRSNNRLRG